MGTALSLSNDSYCFYTVSCVDAMVWENVILGSCTRADDAAITHDSCHCSGRSNMWSDGHQVLQFQCACGRFLIFYVDLFCFVF